MIEVRLSLLDLTYQYSEILHVFDSEDKSQLCQSQSYGNLGVYRGLCSHVVEPLSEVNISLHAQSQLVHVAQVEHGLGVVLLLRGDPVVARGCLVVDVGAPAVVIIIAQSNPSSAVALSRGPNSQSVRDREGGNICYLDQYTSALFHISSGLNSSVSFLSMMKAALD